ncbi:MAG: hypothetical protein WA191_14515 [Telluria sp.]
MTTMKKDPLILGLLLIGGAFLYTRRAAALPLTTASGRQVGIRAMPGNVGTGTSQMVGGAIGSFLQSLASGNLTGSYAQTLRRPEYIDNLVVQERAWDMNTPDVVVPGAFSTTGGDQVWTVG